ncbi:MAG TPA: hypothetical protein VMN38_06455 [Sphingomicrobium sp.]|nr:hypothetical protein [Sphingomicrobium sp.]
MNVSAGPASIAVLTSSFLAMGLAGCTQGPLELRCAAFFDRLSKVAVGDVTASDQAAYRQHASAFIDLLPGKRADNVAAMHRVGDSIMADDGLSEQCDDIIPLGNKVMEIE